MNVKNRKRLSTFIDYTLTEEEKQELIALIKKVERIIDQTRADPAEIEQMPGQSGLDLRSHQHISTSTIASIAKRFIMDGMEAALERKNGFTVPVR